MKIDSCKNETFNKLFTIESDKKIIYLNEDFQKHDHVLCDNQPERSKREDSNCLAPGKCPSVENSTEWLCEACFYD